MCQVCSDDQCHYGEYCFPKGVSIRVTPEVWRDLVGAVENPEAPTVALRELMASKAPWDDDNEHST